MWLPNSSTCVHDVYKKTSKGSDAEEGEVCDENPFKSVSASCWGGCIARITAPTMLPICYVLVVLQLPLWFGLFHTHVLLKWILAEGWDERYYWSEFWPRDEKCYWSEFWPRDERWLKSFPFRLSFEKVVKGASLGRDGRRRPTLTERSCTSAKHILLVCPTFLHCLLLQNFHPLYPYPLLCILSIGLQGRLEWLGFFFLFPSISC